MWSVSDTITWSRTAMPRDSPARFMRWVISNSAELGRTGSILYFNLFSPEKYLVGL
jgi:hypothetical protein